jgi:hypothetical protein
MTAADLISALATGTHWDITATDQIRPIVTTTAIPMPVRICIPRSGIDQALQVAQTSPADVAGTVAQIPANSGPFVHFQEISR